MERGEGREEIEMEKDLSGEYNFVINSKVDERIVNIQYNGFFNNEMMI